MSWNFTEFIKERKYLHSVSPRTVEWYEQTFKWLGQYEPTEAGAKAFVIGMRERGLKAVSCNSRIRVANAYFKWAGLGLKIPRLKEEETIIPTLPGIGRLQWPFTEIPKRCTSSKLITTRPVSGGWRECMELVGEPFHR